jgi:tetratricopeptide (TPR) repeat protein
MYDIDHEIEKTRNAVILNSCNPHLNHKLAGLLLKKGNFEESKIYQIKAIELKSDNCFFHIQLSRIYNKLNNIICAIQKAYDAISLDDTNPQFYHFLGCLYFKNGDLEAAKL